MTWRIFGYTLVAVALGIVLFVLYRNSEQSNSTLIYSPSQTLAALWNTYKNTDLNPADGRTLDRSRDNITTSEGESYTMLRAVWMGDKETFDKEWQWTRGNLGRPNDHLFSWLYGQRPDGTYGILTARSGENTASDADTNIALALTFAYARWQDQSYLSAAQAIAHDIWQEETLTIGDRAYVLADNLEKTSASPQPLINPSYLEPAAYRVFALIDPADPWARAVDGAYEVIAESSSRPLGSGGSAGLPPDWAAIDRTTGVVSAPAGAGTDTNFGYDALRVPFNLALDWQWFHDARDEQALQKFSFLETQRKNRGLLYATYTHAGSALASSSYQTPAMYGGTIGYFMLENPPAAKSIYDTKLAYLFTPDWNGWRQSLSYYDDNWAWFGIGLYNGLLPNLTAGLPASFFAQQ